MQNLVVESTENLQSHFPIQNMMIIESHFQNKDIPIILVKTSKQMNYFPK